MIWKWKAEPNALVKEWERLEEDGGQIVKGMGYRYCTDIFQEQYSDGEWTNSLWTTLKLLYLWKNEVESVDIRFISNENIRGPITEMKHHSNQFICRNVDSNSFHTLFSNLDQVWKVRSLLGNAMFILWTWHCQRVTLFPMMHLITDLYANEPSFCN